MDTKASVQQQFSKNAEEYRDERLFAEGEDLLQMVQSASLQGTERVLDIATGAGHTALAFAPYVKECFAIDLTKEMVEVAAELAISRGVSNVRFQIGDAEKLPFEDASFDVITCRFAAHHFPDPEKAVKEVSRVLKHGGKFLLIDHYAPANSELDTFVNKINQMRDPSHVRESSLSEWQMFFQKHGLAYGEILKWDLPLAFQNWTERSNTPLDVRQQLIEGFRKATPLCKETFHLKFDKNGNPDSFCLKAILIQGTK